MKKESALGIVFLFIMNSVFCQDPLKFEGVIYIDSSLTKMELFTRGRQWFSQNFKNEKNVVSIEDKESGEISGNSSFGFFTDKSNYQYFWASGYISYKISIYLKDGRYKYLLHSFVHMGSYTGYNTPISYGLVTTDSISPRPSRGKPNQAVWESIKNRCNIESKKIIASLHEAMITKSEIETDW